MQSRPRPFHRPALNSRVRSFSSVHPEFSASTAPSSRRSSFVICDNSCNISVVSCLVNEPFSTSPFYVQNKYQPPRSSFNQKNIISSNSGPYKSSHNHSKLTDPYQAPASSRLRTLSPTLQQRYQASFSTSPFVNNVPRLFIAVPHLKFSLIHVQSNAIFVISHQSRHRLALQRLPSRFPHVHATTGIQ